MVQEEDRLGAMLERVTRRLRALGLSDRAASLKAGRSADFIRTMRRQHAAGTQRTVSRRALAALAEVLQTSVDWLENGVGAEEVVVTSNEIAKDSEVNFSEARQAFACQASIEPSAAQGDDNVENVLMSKLRTLEIENQRLKQLLGEKALENAMLQDLARKA